MELFEKIKQKNVENDALCFLLSWYEKRFVLYGWYVVEFKHLVGTLIHLLSAVEKDMNALNSRKTFWY